MDYLKIKDISMNFHSNKGITEALTNINFSVDKSDFIRIVKDKQGNICIDKTGKLSGRGAYICHNVECFNKAKKSKKIEKVFETKLTDEIYNDLEKMFNME